MTTALTVTGLAKTYGDAPAVGPVDLAVAGGERVVLLGRGPRYQVGEALREVVSQVSVPPSSF